MHLQSFGNPSQYADEKRGFVEVNLFGVPILGDSPRIVGNPEVILNVTHLGNRVNGLFALAQACAFLSPVWRTKGAKLC